MRDGFWELCAQHKCVIAPVVVYRQWDAKGNRNGSHYVGLRFAALEFDWPAAGPEYYVLLSDHQKGEELLYDTPEQALEEWIKRCRK